MIVAIIGAGPAGMSCANACLSFGLTPLVIERSNHVGGAQRSNFHTNLWLLGSPSESGEELTRRLVAHYTELNTTTLLATTLLAVEQTDAGFTLTLDTPEGLQKRAVQAIVLTTGMRPHATPELVSLAQSSPRVIIGPLNDTIRDHIHGMRVAILGGGDNALDHALFLAERNNHALVCTRGEFSGRKSLLDACRAQTAISLRPHCRPSHISAGDSCVTLTSTNGQSGQTGQTHDYDWLLVMYGYRPNTELLTTFAPAIRPQLTATGHLQIDGWQRTTMAGIYAAGDVTDNVQPAIPTAIAQGLAAAKAIERDGKAGRLKD
jgi:thioredoxin reductase